SGRGAGGFAVGSRTVGATILWYGTGAGAPGRGARVCARKLPCGRAGVGCACTQMRLNRLPKIASSGGGGGTRVLVPMAAGAGPDQSTLARCSSFRYCVLGSQASSWAYWLAPLFLKRDMPVSPTFDRSPTGRRRQQEETKKGGAPGQPVEPGACSLQHRLRSANHG